MLPQNPIFIVGYPRSGTTLLQAILAAQRGLYTLPETHFFNVIYKEIQLDRRGGIKSVCLRQCVQKIREKMDFQFSKAELGKIFKMAQERVLSPKMFFEIIVAQYINSEILENGTSFRWIEKTPNHVYFLENIVSFYPNAQFVNIVRHPVAAIYSRKKSFPFNKYTPVEELAALWVKSIESVETFEKRYPGKAYTVKYEALVEDPDRELSRLVTFLNVAGDMEAIEHCHWPTTFILPWETWKYDAISRKIIKTNPQWRCTMRIDEILKIQNVVQERMKELGYGTSYSCLQKCFNVWRDFRRTSPNSPY